MALGIISGIIREVHALLESESISPVNFCKDSHCLICTIFIWIEACEFISYKWFLTHWALSIFYIGVHLLRAPSPYNYLGPGVWIKPAFIWINMVNPFLAKGISMESLLSNQESSQDCYWSTLTRIDSGRLTIPIISHQLSRAHHRSFHLP